MKPEPCPHKERLAAIMRHENYIDRSEDQEPQYPFDDVDRAIHNVPIHWTELIPIMLTIQDAIDNGKTVCALDVNREEAYQIVYMAIDVYGQLTAVLGDETAINIAGMAVSADSRIIYHDIPEATSGVQPVRSNPSCRIAFRLWATSGVQPVQSNPPTIRKE